mmetsp:Transcript_12249/g.26808  ORF Transcript_12249/g.26808 Transcript_12249/m.26808 type:complete len:239 (-) Transcript_12249:432-1148(-)
MRAFLARGVHVGRNSPWRSRTAWYWRTTFARVERLQNSARCKCRLPKDLLDVSSLLHAVRSICWHSQSTSTTCILWTLAVICPDNRASASLRRHAMLPSPAFPSLPLAKLSSSALTPTFSLTTCSRAHAGALAVPHSYEQSRNRSLKNNFRQRVSLSATSNVLFLYFGPEGNQFGGSGKQTAESYRGIGACRRETRTRSFWKRSGSSLRGFLRHCDPARTNQDCPQLDAGSDTRCNEQ